MLRFILFWLACLVFYAGTLYSQFVVRGSKISLKQSVFMGLDNRLVLSQKHKRFILDGQGYSLWSSGNSSGDILVPEGVELVLQNISIYQYSPRTIQVSSGANLVFGDGCVINFSVDLYDQVLNNQPLLVDVKGDVQLVLQNQSVNLDKKFGFNIFPGKTLTIKNGTVFFNSQLEDMLQDRSVLILKNVKFCLLNSNQLWKAGSIFCEGNVSIFSYTQALIHAISSEFFSVKPGATLMLGPNICFFEDPGTSFLENDYDAKRHFVLEADSSSLVLKDSSFKSSAAGVAFDRGNILFQENVVLDTVDKNIKVIWDISRECVVTWHSSAKVKSHVYLNAL